uniref:Uncharacterized protein n=2 Tax=Lotharella globosa TaxID=91324 RepID=A0A7S4DXS8_9EUKA
MAGAVAQNISEQFIRKAPVQRSDSKTSRRNSSRAQSRQNSKILNGEGVPPPLPSLDVEGSEQPADIELSQEDQEAKEESELGTLTPTSNGNHEGKKEIKIKEEEEFSEEVLKTMSKEELVQRFLDAEALRRASESRLREAEATIDGYQRGIRQILNCIILSPMMNHFYRQKLTQTLESVFVAVDSITKVIYINCSFPSIEDEFPEVKLKDWQGLPDSRWKVSWSPSWHITARVEGSHYLSFTLNIRIHKLKVDGDCLLSCAKDLSSVTISFPEVPTVSLQIDTVIALGILPIPLSIMKESISTRVKGAFISWLKRSLVAPASMSFPCLRSGLTLTEEAILEEAKAAAKVAQRSLDQSL